jgi:hypothetical protein
VFDGYDGNDTLLSDNDPEEQTAQENYEEFTEPEIILHALIGWTKPKTIWIATKIDSHDVIILIDSKSTDNFIIKRMAIWLQLPLVPT